MKLLLEDELKQWMSESQSAVAVNLRLHLLADSDIADFLKCLVELEEADK